MIKQSLFEIKENIEIAKSVYKMTLIGDTSAFKKPGQFINIKLDGFYLRRPISVCDYDKEKIIIIYKIVGKGTNAMAKMKPNDKLDLLTGLGNGFDLKPSGDVPLVVGGGVGVPPMYELAKQLKNQGKNPVAILGFNTKDEVFYKNEFEALGVKTIITTLDGSVGLKGFVTAAFELAGDYTYFYTCGPEPMLKAVYNAAITSGQLSFEERMGCGFGACMGCSCKTKYGYKRICKEGPVLLKEDIVW